MTVTKCKITCEDIIYSDVEIGLYAQFDATPPSLAKRERLRLLFSYLSGGHFFWRDIDGKKAYSVYAPSTRLTVTDLSLLKEEESSIEWNKKEPFLNQLFSLLKSSLRPHFHGHKISETFGVEDVFDVTKSSIVLFSSSSTNCSAGEFIKDSSDIGSSLLIQDSRLCVQSYNLTQCTEVAFSSNCKGCSRSYFITGCRNCQNCLFCIGLEDKEYYVNNTFVGKERFEKVLRESQLETQAGIDLAISNFRSIASKDAATSKSLPKSCENNSNVFGVGEARNCADSIVSTDGLKSSVLCVGCGLKAERLFNCIRCYENVSDLTYCFDCTNSRELIGCVGLNNAEYRILNKQYTKHEYFILKEELISNLKKKRHWGNPMGFKYSDFAYNGSLAQHLFSLSKVQVGMFEVPWDDDVESLMVDRLVGNQAVLDQIKDTPRDLQEALQNESGVFVCELSGRLFRYLPGELERYRKLGVSPSPYGHEEQLRQLWQEAGKLL